MPKYFQQWFELWDESCPYLLSFLCSFEQAIVHPEAFNLQTTKPNVRQCPTQLLQRARGFCPAVKKTGNSAFILASYKHDHS